MQPCQETSTQSVTFFLSNSGKCRTTDTYAQFYLGTGPSLLAATHIRNCLTGRLHVWLCSRSSPWGWEVHEKTGIFKARNDTTSPLQNAIQKPLSCAQNRWSSNLSSAVGEAPRRVTKGGTPVLAPSRTNRKSAQRGVCLLRGRFNQLGCNVATAAGSVPRHVKCCWG